MRVIIVVFILLPSFLSLAQSDRRNAFETGKEAWNDSRDSLALSLFNQALSDDPTLTEAYRYRGYVYEDLDQPEKALLDFLMYLKFNPQSAEVLLSASVLHYQLGQYEAAQRGFRTLLTLPAGETQTVYFRRPVHGEGVTSMGTAQSQNKAHLYNYLGLCARGLGNMAMASACLDTAIRIQPDQADYYVNRGEVFKETGQAFLAERDFTQALSLDPGHALARYNLAVLVDESGNTEKAMAFYTQSIRDNPSSPYPYRQRGYRYLMAGDHNNALADFTEAIRLDPYDAETYLNRGITLEALMQYDRALDDYGKAIDLKPDLPKAYFNRGNTLFRMKNYADALNEYNVALIYQQEYPQAFYQRGLTYYYLENINQACADLTRAVEMGVAQAVRAQKKICNTPD